MGNNGAPDAKVLLYVGRFSPEKNCDLILEALTHLPDEWHVIFYGWGINEDKLKNKAKGMFPKSSSDTLARVLFPRPRMTYTPHAIALFSLHQVRLFRWSSSKPGKPVFPLSPPNFKLC